MTHNMICMTYDVRELRSCTGRMVLFFLSASRLFRVTPDRCSVLGVYALATGTHQQASFFRRAVVGFRFRGRQRSIARISPMEALRLGGPREENREIGLPKLLLHRLRHLRG